METSLKMFLQKSYKEVSLRDIVNEVGLTKGAFYHYYTSKEEVFEEAVKYFYNHAIISNYNHFPNTSLKEFYEFYLKTLQEPNPFDDMDGGANFFVFIIEATKRLPNFLQIHQAQREKERWAWAEIIDTAKRSKEIKTNIRNEEIATMFLNMSDGLLMDRTIGVKNGMEILMEVKRGWDNLYSLLATNK